MDIATLALACQLALLGNAPGGAQVWGNPCQVIQVRPAEADGNSVITFTNGHTAIVTGGVVDAAKGVNRALKRNIASAEQS
jgi:hypothetical protein